MKKLLALVLALIMAVSLVACGGPKDPVGEQTPNPGPGESEAPGTVVTTPDPTVTYKDTVSIAVSSEITDGAYYSTSSTQSSYIGTMTHEGLFDNDYVNGGVVARLAESAVDVNGDGKTWKITIKKGVMFHHGDQPYQEMKASDVKYTYEYTAAGGVGANEGVVVRTNTTMNYVEKIEVTGDYELVFHLTTPLFDFPAYATAKIICEAAMTEFGTKDGQDVCSGPYYINFAKSTKGQEWTLTRYDEYWGGVEEFPTKNIVFVLLADQNTAAAALQNGEVDIMHGVTVATSVMFMNNPDYVLYDDVASVTLPSLFLNSYDDKGLFDGEDEPEQIKLRQAIRMAIDKEKVVNVVYAINPAGGSRADSVWNPNMGDFVSYKSEFNLDKARQMMNELGYNENNKLSVKLVHYSSYTDFAVIIQEMLKEIYIEVKLETVDSSVFGTLLRTGEDWDLAVNYYTPAQNMAGVMSNNLHSTGSNTKVYGWASAEMDKRIDEIMAMTNADDQIAAFKEFQTWANDYVPGRIPVYSGNVLMAAAAEVEGLVICPTGSDQNFTTVRIPE